MKLFLNFLHYSVIYIHIFFIIYWFPILFCFIFHCLFFPTCFSHWPETPSAGITASLLGSMLTEYVTQVGFRFRFLFVCVLVTALFLFSLMPIHLQFYNQQTKAPHSLTQNLANHQGAINTFLAGFCSALMSPAWIHPNEGFPHYFGTRLYVNHWDFGGNDPVWSFRRAP